ncbi:MAG TPA: hypothetical protein VK612_09715 [Pyrinomonadaceae bacterium]|nr:hypothetical protein [Pyrinomonadaceae bacterium]
MKSFVAQVQLISNLQQFAERAFVNKLKKQSPDISPQEIVAELNRWYMDRPGAPNGDGVGRIGDPSRFKIDSKSTT